jgi:hypothetical protein
MLATAPHLSVLWLFTDLFPRFLFVPVDLFTTDVESRRWHFDLRRVLLHLKFLPTAPQPIGVVCVTNVVFNVDV